MGDSADDEEDEEEYEDDGDDTILDYCTDTDANGNGDDDEDEDDDLQEYALLFSDVCLVACYCTFRLVMKLLLY